jgi:phosphoglycerol transferase MdoB-like AlkP superfamily enzyme
MNWKITLNEYLVLLARFALVMLLYASCRIGFYWFNSDLFDNLTIDGFAYIMAGGTKFDLSALLYINALYLLLFLFPFRFKFRRWYRSVLKWLFIITNGIGLAANVADFIYYRFTLKRTTASVFDIFSNEDNMLVLWGQFLIDYWYALLFWGVLMVILIWGYSRFKSKPFLSSAAWWKYSLLSTGIFLLVGGLTVAGMRGGFRHSTRPINISNSARYVERPEEVSIVLNTPFAVFRTLGKSTFEPVDFFAGQNVDNIYSPVYNKKMSVSGSYEKDAAGSRPNVVLIILESFGREHIGSLNVDLDDGNYKGYTPFLDSLIHQSWAFNRAYANGRKSIDALPSIVASVPSLVQPYIVSEYANNRINGLAGLLKEVGYQTAFYHGAPNGSMGLWAFSKMAGYEEYLGKTEYGNDADFDGMWGIWDEPFFQFFADDMNRLKEPFLTTIFSISSHHPFAVPEKYEGVFPEGPLPLHQCMGYTDMALKRFFETASKTSWYENTLFVITADHCTIPFHQAYKTPVESFAVPLLFFKPGEIPAKMDGGLAQQTDILPTVLSFLEYPDAYLAFGNDLFSTNPEERFVANYFNESFQFLQGDYVLYFNGKEVTDVYNLKNDPLQKHNLVNQEDIQDKEEFMKAFIQQYINRMRNDELTLN